MAMSMDQVAKELQKNGEYEQLLAVCLHWLKQLGHLKPMSITEKDDLVNQIQEVLPAHVVDAVNKNGSLIDEEQ